MEQVPTYLLCCTRTIAYEISAAPNHRTYGGATQGADI